MFEKSEQEMIEPINGCVSLYVDGGVVQKNPSTIGGTWACVFVDAAGNEISRVSGFVTPAEIGLEAVTNNYTELLAAVEGLSRVAWPWTGTIFTDSNVTRCRLTGKNPGMNGIPFSLCERLRVCRKGLDPIVAVLLDGHPTKKQLEAGVGKRGSPVSKFNVLCDRLCGEEAARYLAHVAEARATEGDAA